jgi:hypothetical protein
MAKTRGLLLIAAAALLVAGVGVYVSGQETRGPWRPAPTGQPPVAKLDLEDFQKTFNAAADRPRLLLTFSPT